MRTNALYIAIDVSRRIWYVEDIHSVTAMTQMNCNMPAVSISAQINTCYSLLYLTSSCSRNNKIITKALYNNLYFNPYNI